MGGETPFFHVMIWNDPPETTILTVDVSGTVPGNAVQKPILRFFLFGFPGRIKAQTPKHQI